MNAKRLLDSALWYAEKLGWPVLPLHSIVDGHCACGKADCASPGKHPHTKHGLKDSSTDPEVIHRWWSDWPDANVGIRTGVASGLVVLDIDPRNGGDQSLDVILHEQGDLPPTVEALTGGGGRHIIFAHPGDGAKITRSSVGLGIDVKSDGGYIVAPPSVHISGEQYRWRQDHGPHETQPAALPNWLREMLVPAPRSGSTERGGRSAAGGTCRGVPDRSGGTAADTSPGARSASAVEPWKRTAAIGARTATGGRVGDEQRQGPTAAHGARQPSSSNRQN